MFNIETFIFVALFLLCAFLSEAKMLKTLFVTVIASICGYSYFGNSIIAIILNAQISTIMQVTFAYLVAGFVWSIIRWTNLLYEFKKEFDAQLNKFKVNTKLDPKLPIPENLRSKFFASLHYEFCFKFKLDHGKPSVRNYAREITGWITYWPFNIVGFTVRVPAKKFMTFAFQKIKQSYQSILDRILNNEEFKYDKGDG